MRFHYDLAGVAPIIRKMKAVAGTYYDGAGVACGVTDGTDIGLIKPAAGVFTKFVGMSSESKVTTGTLALKTVEDIQTIINPYAVYLVEYAVSDTGIAVAGWDAGTKVLTFACTSGKGHPDLGSGFVYRSTDPGAGELNMIDSSSVSTTTCSVVLESAPTTTPTTSSKFHLIYPVGRYNIDLCDSGRKIKSNDLDSGGETALTEALPVSILANYIQYDGEEMQRLTDALHAELTALDDKNVHFYADVCFFNGSWLNV